MQEEPPSFLPILSFGEPSTTSPIGLNDDWLSPELANFLTEITFAAPKPIKVEEPEPLQDETPNHFFSEPNSPLIPVATLTTASAKPVNTTTATCCGIDKALSFVLKASHDCPYDAVKQGRSFICTLLCCLIRLLPNSNMFLKTFLPTYITPKELFCKIECGDPVHTNVKNMEFMDWCFPAYVLHPKSPLNYVMCMYIKMMQHVILQRYREDVYEAAVLPELVLRCIFPFHSITSNGKTRTADYRSESQQVLSSPNKCYEESRFELHMESRVSIPRVFELHHIHAKSSCLGLIVIGSHAHLVVPEKLSLMLFDPHGAYKEFPWNLRPEQEIDVYFVKERF